jgi:hypothetical protein
MKTIFQGHVDRVDWSPPNSILVTVHAQADVCDHPIVLRMPEKEVAHWLVGRLVSITAVAMEAPKTETPNAT